MKKAGIFSEIKTMFQTSRLVQVLVAITIILGIVHFSLIIWQPFFQNLLK